MTAPLVRRGADIDIRQTAELLNEIIALGGTTAMTDPLSADEMHDWLTEAPDRSAWVVALDQSGALLGFQWIGVTESLPSAACDIATFVRAGQTGLGVGSALFNAIQPAARDLGYDWINAEIRADNTGGLIYYQSRGFEDYGRVPAMRLDDGTTVDKVLKRYTL